MKLLEKNRDEIEDIYKWNLSSIYKNDQCWENDFKLLKTDLKKINGYRNKITLSSESLYNFLEYYFYIMEKEYKILVYSYLKKDQDISNEKYQKMSTKADNLTSEIQSDFSFVESELLKTDYTVIKKYITTNNKLKKYSFYLENIYRFQKYVLSEDKEKLLASIDTIDNNLQKTSEIIRNVELKFGFIRDENNNKIELTNANYYKYIKSNDRNIRKSAYNKSFSKYEEVNGSLATTFINHLNVDSIISKERGYDSTLDMYLYNNNITKAIYNNLISTVNQNLNVFHKYYKLKKKVLNLKTLYPYDLSTKLSKEYNKKFTYLEAKKIILGALNVFGSDYIEVLNKAFDERWIDIFSNKGKRSGFYSWGVYKSNPVILANYQGTLNDVSALAHELGHSVHSYYSNENNMFHDADYKIFVAEVASLTNELILSQYLLNKSMDKNEKLAILDNILDLFVGNLFGSTRGAEFEQIVHNMSDNNEVLTASVLNDIFDDLNKKYYGKEVKNYKYAKYGWTKISHFYSSFYYYQYATGISAATYIANKIMNGNKEILNKYLKYLKLGNTMYPLDLLKTIGLDMSDPKIIEEAIKFFENKIEEFDKLIDN